MGRAKSGGHTGRPTGSTKDRYWLDEGRKERRFNHAMDLCKLTIGQNTKCLICKQATAICIQAGVTRSMGARSWWRCTGCGHQFTRTISSETMSEYYIEDLKDMLASRAREANA